MNVISTWGTVIMWVLLCVGALGMHGAAMESVAGAGIAGFGTVFHSLSKYFLVS